MNSKDLPLTIADTQKALKKRALSAVELTQSYLSRIKTNDSSLNSFITVCEDKARRSAARVDKTIKELGDDAFQKYPLLGAVVAHKDMYLTKGVRTTAGSKVLESYIPQYSASVVERIEKAGAIMIGKTNQDAWAHGSSGENSDFGPTKNPWNREYVPGGSSSGSAAAVSADFATLATSTDTCGSTRLPANFCGVVGLKPTYGAISRYGVVAMASSLDSMGNITKTVGDSKKVFDVTKGEDKKDSTVKLADGKRNMENGKYTIGIPKEFFGEGLEGCVREKIYEAIDIFKKAGVEFKDVSLPHTKYAISAYYIIQPAEVTSNLGRYDGIRYGEDRDLFGIEAKRRIMLGTYVLSAGYYDAFYLKAMKVRSVIIAELEHVFDKVNVLIAPVSPTPAFKLGDRTEDPLKMYLTDIFAATASLCGTPSIALPHGFTKDSLPLGFQLMGSRFSENILFDLGEMFERLTSFKPQVADI